MSKDTKTGAPETFGAKPVAAESKFAIEKLRENCVQLFNVSDSTFAGASAGLTGEYTIGEMKNIIATWLKKEVK